MAGQGDRLSGLMSKHEEYASRHAKVMVMVMVKSMLPGFADHFILIMLQRANGSDGQGQNRRREGSDGDISSLSDGRWAVRALQKLCSLAYHHGQTLLGLGLHVLHTFWGTPQMCLQLILVSVQVPRRCHSPKTICAMSMCSAVYSSHKANVALLQLPGPEPGGSAEAPGADRGRPQLPALPQERARLHAHLPRVRRPLPGAAERDGCQPEHAGKPCACRAAPSASICQSHP